MDPRVCAPTTRPRAGSSARSTTCSSRSPSTAHAIEIAPFDIGQFGLPAVERVPVVGLPYLIAQKLHACTELHADRDNPRVRDLVDLLLARELLRPADLTRVREACVAIFDDRDTHTWPPTLRPPTSWAGPYAKLANEQQLPVTDVEHATQEVQHFIETIDRAWHGR